MSIDLLSTSSLFKALNLTAARVKVADNVAHIFLGNDDGNFHYGFEKNRIAVVAWSADDQTQTASLVSKYGLTFPIGYGADPTAVSEATGAFVSVDPPQLQSTAFVVDPSGRVLLSLYSCGAFGQLLPDDVIELVREHG